mgnify:CR=1 FL=1
MLAKGALSKALLMASVVVLICGCSTVANDTVQADKSQLADTSRINETAALAPQALVSKDGQKGVSFAELEKRDIEGAGLVMVHPTLNVGDYDAVRFTGVSLRYREGQRPLPEYREANLRGAILHKLTQSSLAAGTTIAEQAGACVVDVKVAVLNIDIKGVGRTGAAKRSLGSATLAYDMRDSATGEPIVTLAGKRDFGPGLDKSGRRDDFKRLSKHVGDLMVVLGQSLGYVISDDIDAREGAVGKAGCNAELRKSAAAARAAAMAK